MIRATLDVNVLVSGFQGTAGSPTALVDAWIDGRFELVLSEHILGVVVRAWRKPYFQRQMTQGDRDFALMTLREAATFIIPGVEVQGVGEDREDDLVLSTAISGGAEYLVTGDKHLQGVGVFRGVIILSPRGLLEVLDDL